MVPLMHNWTEEELTLRARKYQTRGDFALKEMCAYAAARHKGVLNKICAHMIEINHIWTKSELIEEALQYSSRNDFSQKSVSAYSVARKRGILDEICEHMIPAYPAWTKEAILQEALKYKTRTSFSLGNWGAWNAAHKMGIIHEVSAHMDMGGTSVAEQELLDIIKREYPSARKFKDFKLRVEGKPFIKQGFEIDIYIPELHKGIEYDGIWTHSVEGLHRSRPHWPLEDIKNYHQIKDDAFKSKGITLLHISEADWISDKAACVIKCFDFLK
jgi:hypothetical protein